MRDLMSARDEGGNSGDGRSQNPIKPPQGKRRDVFESGPGLAALRPQTKPQEPNGGSHNGLKPPVGT